MSAYTVTVVVGDKRVTLPQNTNSMGQAARVMIAAAIDQLGEEPSEITVTVAQVPQEFAWEEEKEDEKEEKEDEDEEGEAGRSY